MNRAVRGAPRRDTLACPWNGVSLGGWLLLEPGPSYPLFSQHPDPRSKKEQRCEWELMQVLRKSLGKAKAFEVLKEHRDTHITKSDFERIRSYGLNAVRLPFGYWVVTGPSAGEPYFGPAIEYIDQAVTWAEECGLQIVLDLHGCPGGESGEAPCGRRQRPNGKWHWKQWRARQSLEALEVLALRYRSRKCVTGIEVCNEPSNTIPQSVLINYYDRAVEKIRQAGMPSSRVAVILPVFQRPEERFALKWQAVTGGKHRNICFDVHCYHCFENSFNGMTFAEHLRETQENAAMLRGFPMVVGEWSLSLGCAAWSTCGKMDESEVYKLFGAMQAEAFKEASHGHFFWNWTEADDNAEWNFQKAYAQGLLGSSLRPRPLPAWDGRGEDPLEEIIHPSPAEPHVCFGDTVYLRVFYGRYMDVEGSRVDARWPDKGFWQEFTFCSVAGEGAPKKTDRRVRHGDVVRLRSHSGRFIAVLASGSAGTCAVTALPASRAGDTAASAAASSRGRGGRRGGGSSRGGGAHRGAGAAVSDFRVELEHGSKVLRHRGCVHFRSLATGRLIDVDEDEDGIFARFRQAGEWNSLVVEKVVEDSAPLITPMKSASGTLQRPGRAGRKEEDAPLTSPPKSRDRATARRRCNSTACATTASVGGFATLTKTPSKQDVTPAKNLSSPKNLKRRLASPGPGRARALAGGHAPEGAKASAASWGSHGVAGSCRASSGASHTPMRSASSQRPAAKMARVR